MGIERLLESEKRAKRYQTVPNEPLAVIYKDMEPPQTPLVISQRFFARATGMSRRQVLNLVKRGVLQTIPGGTRILTESAKSISPTALARVTRQAEAN